MNFSAFAWSYNIGIENHSPNPIHIIYYSMGDMGNAWRPKNCGENYNVPLSQSKCTIAAHSWVTLKLTVNAMQCYGRMEIVTTLGNIIYLYDGEGQYNSLYDLEIKNNPPAALVQHMKAYTDGPCISKMNSGRDNYNCIVYTNTSTQKK